MFKSNPSKDWVRFGAEDPFFGVLSSQSYRREGLDAERIEAFYNSGRAHIDRVLANAKRHFDFEPRGKALDFGCGVGRLVEPLAARFQEVVGIDISEGMLEHARSHAREVGITNVTFANNGREYAIPENTFDFVHSYIVLQHMRTKNGEQIFRDLVSSLKIDGVGVVHFTYGHVRGPNYHAVREWLKRNVVTRVVGNIVLGHKWDRPAMLMSAYNIERMLGILGECNIENLHVQRVDDWGFLGLYVFFKKGRGSMSEFSNPVRSSAA